MYTPSKEFCEPFILTEENIRKIVKIIEDNRPKYSKEVSLHGQDLNEQYNPVFTYRRLDNYEQETTSITALFKEENHGMSRITSLEIASNNYSIADAKITDTELNYEIRFRSCEDADAYDDINLMLFNSITIGVKGIDRTKSEFLFKELDNYIQNSVISKKYRLLVSIYRRMFSLRISILVLLLIVTLYQTFPLLNKAKESQSIITNALESSDMIEKVDALLSVQMISDTSVKSFFPIVTMMGVVMLIYLISFSKKLKKFFASRLPFVFEFGRSPEDYQTRIRGVKAVLGVIGALIIGVFGNFLWTIISNLLQ